MARGMRLVDGNSDGEIAFSGEHAIEVRGGRMY